MYEELMRRGNEKLGINESAKVLRVSRKTAYAYQECRGPDQTQCANPVEKMVDWLAEISKRDGLILAMKIINLYLERSINAYEDRD